MRVTLDGLEIPGGAASLGEAMEDVRRRAEEQGRILVEALGDGIALEAGLLEDPSRAGTYGTLEFISADPRALVGDALREAAGLLGGVRQEQGAVVMAIDGAETDTARKRLESVLGVWATCIATVRDGCAMLGVDLRAPIEGIGSPQRHIGALVASLEEIRRCLGAEDWAGLGDVVGEDLEERSGEWEALLQGLIERTGGARLS